MRQVVLLSLSEQAGAQHCHCGYAHYNRQRYHGGSAGCGVAFLGKQCEVTKSVSIEYHIALAAALHIGICDLPGFSRVLGDTEELQISCTCAIRKRDLQRDLLALYHIQCRSVV